MIAPGRLVLLDTNVLVYLARWSAAGRWIDREFALSSRPERPLYSTITVGEVLRIAERNGWGEARRDRLRALFINLVAVHPGRGRIVEHYAAIGAELDARGIAVRDNDLWIAATAAEAGAVLLTTDRDFDPMHPHPLERIYIDPAALPTS